MLQEILHLDPPYSSIAIIVTAAIDNAAEEGCGISNMSFGGPSPEWNMYKAIRKANRASALLIVAAGNGGDDNILTEERSEVNGSNRIRL